jgi:hypothetical protein
MLVQRPGAPRPGSARAAEFVFERCLAINYNINK